MSRAAEGEGPAVQRRQVTGGMDPKERKQVLRPADIQPIAKPTKACPLQEGDAVVLARPPIKGSNVTPSVGMIVAQVEIASQSYRRGAAATGPMYEVLWSNGQIGLARGTALRKIVEDPDL